MDCFAPIFMKVLVIFKIDAMSQIGVNEFARSYNILVFQQEKGGIVNVCTVQCWTEGCIEWVMGNDEKMGNQSQTPKRIPKAVPRNPSAQYGVDRKYLIPTLGPRDKICRFPPIGEDKFNPITMQRGLVMVQSISPCQWGKNAKSSRRIQSINDSNECYTFWNQSADLDIFPFVLGSICWRPIWDGSPR